MPTPIITNSVGLTLEYDDGTTRNYNFTGMETSTLVGLKSRVITMNGNLADSVAGAAYHETFISDEGAPVKRISKAKHTVTEEQVIYRA